MDTYLVQCVIWLMVHFSNIRLLYGDAIVDVYVKDEWLCDHAGKSLQARMCLFARGVLAAAGLVAAAPSQADYSPTRANRTHCRHEKCCYYGGIVER